MIAGTGEYLTAEMRQVLRVTGKTLPYMREMGYTILSPKGLIDVNMQGASWFNQNYLNPDAGGLVDASTWGAIKVGLKGTGDRILDMSRIVTDWTKGLADYVKILLVIAVVIVAFLVYRRLTGG